MVQWVTDFVDALEREFGRGPKVATLATLERAAAAYAGAESADLAGVRPRARSVICRRVDEAGAVWITSDARSGKNSQLRTNPWAELVFWLPTPRRQYRISGIVEMLDAADVSEARLSQWRALSDATRATFAWPAPGGPKPLDSSSYPRLLPADADIPAAFEVLILKPLAVDVLDLTTHPHRRRAFQIIAGIWRETELSP